MDPGDIVWVDFPPRGGREQAGRRPAIVFQTDEAGRRLSTVLLLPLTTQLEALRFPGTILIEPDEANGLSRPCVALVFQLTAVDRRALSASVGHVGDGLLEALRSELNGLTRGES